MTTQAVPNLIGMRAAHRAMRADARRLAELVTRLANGTAPYDARRAVAVRDYVTGLCSVVRHHHSKEDDVLWPVLVRTAGAEVDLSELTDDHAALDPVLEEIEKRAATFARASGDRHRAWPLASALARLRDMLDEHIEEEEQLIFPIIHRYVSVAEWEKVEQAVRRGGPFRAELPRIERYADAEELAELHRLAGPTLRLILALLRRGFRRQERLVFG